LTSLHVDTQNKTSFHRPETYFAFFFFLFDAAAGTVPPLSCGASFLLKSACTVALSPGRAPAEPPLFALDFVFGLRLLTPLRPMLFFSSLVESLLYELDLPLAQVFSILEAIGQNC
jgi:hypothetical protein